MSREKGPCFTRKVYWHDTYKYTHKSEIIAKGSDENGFWISLKETIFHPQGGGQPSDQGTIQNIEVTLLKEERLSDEVMRLNDADYDQGVIRHYLDCDPDFFEIGNTVSMKINKDFRLLSAALHTAGHMIAGYMRKEEGYKEQSRANHFPGESRVEFIKGGNEFDTEKAISNVDDMISNNLEIKATYGDVDPIYRQEGRSPKARIISIAGLWAEPCSGTHVRSTNEISDFSIKKISSKKEKKSVSYEANHWLFSKKYSENLSGFSKKHICENGIEISFSVSNESLQATLDKDGIAYTIPGESIHINEDSSNDKTSNCSLLQPWMLEAITNIEELTLLSKETIVVTKYSNSSSKAAAAASY